MAATDLEKNTMSFPDPNSNAVFSFINPFLPDDPLISYPDASSVACANNVPLPTIERSPSPCPLPPIEARYPSLATMSETRVLLEEGYKRGYTPSGTSYPPLGSNALGFDSSFPSLHRGDHEPNDYKPIRKSSLCVGTPPFELDWTPFIDQLPPDHVYFARKREAEAKALAEKKITEERKTKKERAAKDKMAALVKASEAKAKKEQAAAEEKEAKKEAAEIKNEEIKNGTNDKDDTTAISTTAGEASVPADASATESSALTITSNFPAAPTTSPDSDDEAYATAREEPKTKKSKKRAKVKKLEGQVAKLVKKLKKVTQSSLSKVTNEAEPSKETKKRKAEENVDGEKLKPAKKAKKVSINDDVNPFALAGDRDEVKIGRDAKPKKSAAKKTAVIKAVKGGRKSNIAVPVESAAPVVSNALAASTMGI